jgi:hypothetical protein
MVIQSTLFELSSRPITKDEWVTAAELEHYFSTQNPWEVENVVSIGDEEYFNFNTRYVEVNNLHMGLPEGYEARDETIAVHNPKLFWNDVIEHLADLAKKAERMDIDHEEPLIWWKNYVNYQFDNLIFFRDDQRIMTLFEFLLFMVNQKDRISSLYFGGIFYVGND